MTDSQFESLLQDDLSWRKKEISELLLMAQSSQQQEILLKSLILVLYSHWEGYIKKSTKVYLKYISEKKIKIQNLTLNFKAIHLKSLSQECMKNQGSTSLAREIELITKYEDVNKKNFKFSINPENDAEESIVETKHNLKPKILKNIFNLIGIEYWEPIKIREQYLDANLLNNRNAISHGSKIKEETHRDFKLTLEEVKKLKEVVVLIIDLFQETLMTYQENEFYLLCNEEKLKEYNYKVVKKLEKDLKSIEGT